MENESEVPEVKHRRRRSEPRPDKGVPRGPRGRTYAPRSDKGGKHKPRGRHTTTEKRKRPAKRGKYKMRDNRRKPWGDTFAARMAANGGVLPGREAPPLPRMNHVDWALERALYPAATAERLAEQERQLRLQDGGEK